ncbi:N-acetylmuramic acid 6-phosphate etherase [Paracoccaceae bacterium]|nr:N-acetylmuramic acid 6-phosphate etherase [Paracoccaceae bacterium]
MQTTEKLHPEAIGLDKKSDLEILTILYESQIEAAKCVSESMASLEAGAKAMADAVLMGNKLVYAAAGSSGLQGMADGLELTPTFGIPISQIKILRAGGLQDMSQPKGNMEDNKLAAISDAEIIEPGDCVICLAASGNTTYPSVIMKTAKKVGATTIGIANNPDTELLVGSDIPILLLTPPEVIAGSTRLGAGTAQKIALNTMSTYMGILLGHVMDGQMVNLIANNAKLFKRSEKIVMNITGCNTKTAKDALTEANGAVKLAILLISGAKSILNAQNILEGENQNLRSAIRQIKSENFSS